MGEYGMGLRGILRAICKAANSNGVDCGRSVILRPMRNAQLQEVRLSTRMRTRQFSLRTLLSLVSAASVLFSAFTFPGVGGVLLTAFACLLPALVVMLMQKWFVKGLVDTEK